MKELEIRYVDNADPKKIELPTHLSYRQQQKIRSQIEVEYNLETEDKIVRNATEFLNNIQRELVEMFLEKRGIDTDRITGDTADDLLNLYITQIQGNVKKNI